MDMDKKQEIIHRLITKFKEDFGNYGNSGEYYLRGVVDAIYELEKINLLEGDKK